MRAELIARVESATGQLDDETIARIVCYSHGVEYGCGMRGTGDDGSDELTVYSADEHFSVSDYRSRWPDVSLDAALALVERMIPGAYIELSGPRKYLNIPTPVPNYWRAGLNDWDDHGRCWGATPALALLSALLRALPEPQDPPE